MAAPKAAEAAEAANWSLLPDGSDACATLWPVSKVEEALRAHGVARPDPYMIFCQAERPRIVKVNPSMAFGEVDKALGAAWGKLSDAQKANVTAPCDRLPSPSHASGRAPAAPPPPRSPDAPRPAKLGAVAATPVPPSPPEAAPPVVSPPPPAIPRDSPFARAAKPEDTAGGGGGGGGGAAAPAPFSFAFSLEAAKPKVSTTFSLATAPFVASGAVPTVPAAQPKCAARCHPATQPPCTPTTAAQEAGHAFLPPSLPN